MRKIIDRKPSVGFRVALIICTGMMSISGFAQGQSAEQEVAAFMQKYQTAASARDIAYIESVLAHDYSYTNPYGTAEKRAAYIDFFRQEKANPTFKVNSLSTDGLLIRVYGDTAVVTSDWKMHSTSKFAHAGDPPHQDKGRYTGILVKQNGRWTIVQEHESEETHDKKIMEAQVAALGRAYTDMIKRNDPASIANILADDYVVTDENGKRLTKAEDLATYAHRAKTLQIASVEYKDQKVRMITGSVALEHSTIRFIGTKNEKPFDITERITTTYAFREGRWLIVADHFSFVK